MISAYVAFDFNSEVLAEAYAKIYRFRTGTACVLAALGSFPTLALAQNPEFGKQDAYFKDQIAVKRSPSISVAVVKNGQVVYAKGLIAGLSVHP